MCSVKVVLPASGCEMIANVRLLAACAAGVLGLAASEGGVFMAAGRSRIDTNCHPRRALRSNARERDPGRSIVLAPYTWVPFPSQTWRFARPEMTVEMASRVFQSTHNQLNGLKRGAMA